jgi:hypothetical protein
MIQSRWLRVLVVAACLTVAVVAVGSIADTHAAVTGPGVTNYYADATYKKIVGTEIYGCCGEYSFTGTKTMYRKFSRLYCLDVLCPY